MNLKTLLLGSAAAFAVVSSAQAADLYVAEPVDYVKVCDAFGVGYWYIPGTDTCLKINGYVRFDIGGYDSKVVDVANNHTGNWGFATKGYVAFTAKSMTDYGPLTGFMAFQSVFDPSSTTNNVANLDEAYLSLGPLLAGKTGSTYDYGGGYTYDGTDLDSDAAGQQLRLSWAMNGMGLMFGIEDPTVRWGSNATNDVPNLIAAMTASNGPWDFKFSAGYADLVTGGGWGAQAAASVKLDQIAPGDAFRWKVAYAEDAYSYAGGSSAGTGSYWSALASFKHFFSPTVYGAWSADYLNDPVGDKWQATAQLTWMPVHNFQVGVEGGNTNTYGSDAWWGKVRLQRDFGG
jgi:hypothetical protein